MKKFLVILVILSFASSAYGSFSENFDSFINGQFLDGSADDNGWKGWGNIPASGAYVVNTPYSSSPNSVQIAGSTDLVHEFTGATSGLWNFTISMYIPTGFSGASQFVLLNKYSDTASDNNWSVQLTFDGSDGRVYDELELNYHEVYASYITGQWVPLSVQIDLVGNTVKTDYNGSLLSTRAWVRDGGSGSAIAGVDLWGTGRAGSVYYDNVSLAPVPIPAAVWLLGSGLIGLIGIRRFRKYNRE
jgi:hypothetical protein